MKEGQAQLKNKSRLQADMDKSKFSNSETLNPTEIIHEHIRRILKPETLEDYLHDIESLEDLLSTEIDNEYKIAEKDIDKKVDELIVHRPGKMNRETYDSFASYKINRKEQYRKRLVFRALVKLAKRKGRWLVDDEEAIISHDKKKDNFYGKKIIERIMAHVNKSAVSYTHLTLPTTPYV